MDGVEAAGGLITGGLIAKLLSRREARRDTSTENHPGACTDCGEPVSGKFCSNCGQPTHVHRSLLHLGEELLHGVMHFDARIWRTLPLLAFNPGRLTREWIQGRRTRYVSPLALFLFTIFLMFFALSLGGAGPIQPAPLPERLTSARAVLAQDRADLDEALAKLMTAQRAEAAAPVEDRPDFEGTTKVASNEFRNAVQNVAAATEDLTRLERLTTAGPRTDGYETGSWQAEIADAVRDGNVTVGLGDKKMEEKVLHKLANPEFAFYKIQQTAYKFAFLLVPLSLPFVWLLFAWKRGFTWYDHGVFVLYSLTFMAILAMVQLGLGRLGSFGESVAALLVFAVPIHMFAQLKGAYQLSILSALWRTLALQFFCSMILIVFVLAIIVLGLTG